MDTLTKLRRAALRAILYPFFAPYINMPGQSFAGRLPNLLFSEERLAGRLRAHVQVLAEDIGVRHIDVPGSLEKSVSYISEQFASSGYQNCDWTAVNGITLSETADLSPETNVTARLMTQTFPFRNRLLTNVIAEVKGCERPDEIVVYGTHYDTVRGSKGSDDNASAIAALIELARLLRFARPARTIRFVAFPNEEHTGESWEYMGSYQYARLCHERQEKIVGMISLEMLGYFSEEPGSQKYPFPFNLFYPDKGDFIAFVGNARSRQWVRQVVAAFRKEVRFPSEGAAPPDRFADINRSDHWGFWQFGYPALMMTDTSNFRYPHLHTMEDTPDKLNFSHMARLVSGMARVSMILTRI